MALATGSADFEPTDTVETTEPLDTPARLLPGLFVVALQERFCLTSIPVQRSHPRWLEWSATSTNDWMSDSVYRPLHNLLLRVTSGSRS